MLFKALTLALLGSAALFEHAGANSLAGDINGPLPRDAGNLAYRDLRASIIKQRSNVFQKRQNAGNNNNDAGNNDTGNNDAGNNGGGNAAATQCLDPAVVQTGSASTGQAGTIDPGQVESLTDTSNFINFCKGETLTNGLQVQAGSCNGVVMGKIPSRDNMISSVLISPQPGEDLEPLKTFTISVQMVGLAAGAFTNAQLTYYSAPQNLDGSGNIIGHTHVTVQDFGKSLTPNSPPDPKTFAFFKGINDAGNGQGLLSATVTGGLPAGNYRVCTMSSSSNHQPVLMPVAQRGAQDDCTKFTVGQGGANANAGAGDENANANDAANDDAAADATSTEAAAATSAAADNADNAADATSATAAAATTSAAAANGGNGRGNGRGGRGGNRNGAQPPKL